MQNLQAPTNAAPGLLTIETDFKGLERIDVPILFGDSPDPGLGPRVYDTPPASPTRIYPLGIEGAIDEAETGGEQPPDVTVGKLDLAPQPKQSDRSLLVGLAALGAALAVAGGLARRKFSR